MRQETQKTCYIVGAGENPGLDFCPAADDFVVAVDGGYRYLASAGLRIDLAVGDFDSLGEIPDHPRVVRLTPEKDDTDTHHAVQIGIERGYDRFALYGCTGGRLAHTLANLHSLAALARQGRRAWMIGLTERVTAIRNASLELTGKGYLSVFAWGGPARVTLSGLKYPLDGYAMDCEYPIGVSNEFIGRPARITAEDGTLIVLVQR